MLWTSRNIAISLKNNEYTENKSTVASIGYNEPSLVFEVGTNIKVFKSIDKFSENFSLFDYLIIVIQEKLSTILILFFLKKISLMLLY